MEHRFLFPGPPYEGLSPAFWGHTHTCNWLTNFIKSMFNNYRRYILLQPETDF